MLPEGHQHRLRAGRVSVPGGVYAVTACVEGRRPLLVADPHRPGATGIGARRLVEALRHLEGERRLVCHGYCVMPDHVHVVLALGPGVTLPAVMKSLRGYTGMALNRDLGLHGPFWQKGYYDHALRRDDDLEGALRYALENPVRKGYAQTPEEWPWSGAAPDPWARIPR